MLIALFGYGLYVIATSYLILELFEDPLDGSKKLVLVSR